MFRNSLELSRRWCFLWSICVLDLHAQYFICDCALKARGSFIFLFVFHHCDIAMTTVLFYFTQRNCYHLYIFTHIFISITAVYTHYVSLSLCCVYNCFKGFETCNMSVSSTLNVFRGNKSHFLHCNVLCTPSYVCF